MTLYKQFRTIASALKIKLEMFMRVGAYLPTGGWTRLITGSSEELEKYARECEEYYKNRREIEERKLSRKVKQFLSWALLGK